MVATLIPLMVAAVVLLVMAKVLAFNREAEDELQRGLRALGQIHAVHAALAEAASGVRGYLLTQDETFLAPYQRAETSLRNSLSQLETDLRDPSQRESLSEISSLVAVKLSNLAKLKSPADRVSSDLVFEYSMDNKLLLDRLRNRIADMETRENQIVAALQSDLQQARRNSQWIIFTTLMAAVVLATLFAQWFARDLIERVRRIRDNAIRIGRGLPPKLYNGGYRDEVAELDSLVVQTGSVLDERLEELRCAKILAEEANQIKTDFLSRTSHELRTPLNAILGFSELLKDAALSPEQSHRLAVIRRSSEHLLQLVNDLLDLSRLENGKMVLQLRATSVSEVALAARDIVSRSAATKSVRLIVSGSNNVLARADAQRLLQILINLMDNAIKFTPKQTCVTVSWLAGAELREGGVEILVSDSGPGITPGREQELFNPFNRLDSQLEGVGLGLAISRSLAEQMGGHLEYRSAAEGGSDFALWLPLSCQAEQSTSAGALPRAHSLQREPVGNPKRPLPWVLIMENPELVMLSETLAARFRVRCIAVSSSADLALVQMEEPCFLMADAPRETLTLASSLTIAKQLYITPEPPPDYDQKHVFWLAPPVTALRLRRFLQEFSDA